ncbi:hypothetical protein ACFL2H_00920 [Planctomycetota bacterium]
MTPIGWSKFLYLAHFAKPKSDRAIFRAIKKRRVTKIVEIGLRDKDFTTNVVRASLKYCGDSKVSYTGIDLFESRPAGQTSFFLKDMYKSLSGNQLKVRLIPGDPMIGLSRFANTLTETELMVISSDVDVEAMEQAWFFVPRMLSDDASVFVCSSTEGTPTAELLTLAEIEQRVAASVSNRRAA